MPRRGSSKPSGSLKKDQSDNKEETQIKNKLDNEENGQEKPINRKSSSSSCDNNINQNDTSLSDVHCESENDKSNIRDQQQDCIGVGVRTKISKGEKKARAALLKLGVEPVPDVRSVRIGRGKQVSLHIVKPEVYKCQNTDTFIIFGDIKAEDIGAQNHPGSVGRYSQTLKEAAALYKQDANPLKSMGFTENQEAQFGKVENDIIDEKDGDYDNSKGIGSSGNDSLETNEKDIQLVMSQANCTRQEAIDALKRNMNDVVEAILNIS